MLSVSTDISFRLQCALLMYTRYKKKVSAQSKGFVLTFQIPYSKKKLTADSHKKLSTVNTLHFIGRSYAFSIISVAYINSIRSSRYAESEDPTVHFQHFILLRFSTFALEDKIKFLLYLTKKNNEHNLHKGTDPDATQTGKMKLKLNKKLINKYYIQQALHYSGPDYSVCGLFLQVIFFLFLR